MVDVLAIDQGGQSSRVLRVSATGEVIAEAREPIDTFSQGVRVEHDPRTVVASVRRALAAHDGAAAAALATQRSSIVCWDRESGEPLSPVISWQDRRAADLLESLAPPLHRVRQITGLVCSPHYGASKLRWCLDNLPAVAEAGRAGTLAMGPLASYLLFSLLDGQPFVADPANASRTLLWDLRTGDWSTELLEAFGIARELLPACTASRAQFGRLTDAAAPLTVCTGDQNAAAFADGPLQPGTAMINIGTGAFVLAPAESLPGDTPLLRSVAWRDADGSIEVLEGTVNGAASALAAHSASPEEVTAAMTALGGPGVPLFLNGVSGLGSPFWRDRFESRFIGDGSRSERITAIVESVLFLLQVNLDLIGERVALKRITVSGGLANHDGLCQGLADLSGLAASRPAEREATARGLAFLAAGEPADWNRGAGDSFTPRECVTLQGRYRRWRQAMDSALAADEF